MTTRKQTKLEGGELSIDPTENVKALSQAANQRQDDLREANDKLFQMQVECIRNEVALRAEFAKEIRILNDDRLEKIRQVDVLAGNTAADRALVAIQTLATTQAAAAETLRSMVTTTATTIATQNAETVAQLSGRIAQLEKSSYEGAGKGTGAKNLWGFIAGGVVLLVTLFMAALTVGGVVVAIAYAVRGGG